MKIGLWLQDHRNDTEKRFNEVMNIVKKSDVDLIVLPEDAYIPFNHLLEEEDYVFTTLGKWFSEADKLAKKIGKPMMLSARQDIYFENTKDPRPFIFSYYTNPQATENETINRVYFKNTMTGYSPLEFEDYENSILEQWNQYAPIFLKGKKNRHDNML
jgi:phosphoserine aminotransferase